MKHFLLLLTLFGIYSMQAQDNDRKIQFPDIEGYQSLICDFHIHTVFSDGSVWPDIRIQEAVRDGLDAISLTEHIEYQPHLEDIPHPDRNRSYHLALEYAKPYDLLVIHGTEITRDMPPGHANALFVTDVNEIMVEDSLKAYRIARSQGAFIFWNHPNWIPQQKDALPTVSDFHKKLIAEGLLHGLEVVNDLTFSEEGLRVANETGLTVMGTSDIHGLVDYQYEVANGGHRPITIVFAKAKTEEAIKDALFSGRTVTWFNDILAGKSEHMDALLKAALQLEIGGYIGDSEVLNVTLTNDSDARLFLQNSSSYSFYAHTDIIEIEPQSSKKLQVITSQTNLSTEPLTFQVLNAKVGYKKSASISWSLQ